MKRTNLLPSLLFPFIVLFFLSACRLLQTGDSTPTAPIITTPPDEAAYETLTAVSQAIAPPRDMVDLAAQLRGIDAPRIAQTEATPYQLRQIETFWVSDVDTDENRQVEARLVHRSDLLNMWVEVDVPISLEDLGTAVATIEQQIIPTNRAFFGTEWQPGIDGDERMNILHVEDLGRSAVAYFSTADEVVTAVNPYSNQREMLTISLDDAPLGSDMYLATIAHEWQHAIQWHTDPNETGWMSEGLAELAGHVNGYEIGRQHDYVARTDIQLTDLTHNPDTVAYHYAAASLFAVYIYDRFGEAATQALVRDPGDGVAGFATLNVPFDTIFADWLVANYLTSIGRGQGVHQYHSLTLPAMKPKAIRRLSETQETAVHQYGADYYHIEGDEPVTLIFTGTQQVNLMEAEPHNGRYFYATLPADESNMTMTRAFDLSHVDAATLTFWAWYEIETGWDYGYVSVSVDDGRSWQLLTTESTTLDNPQGNSFGAGYTGLSGGGDGAEWVQETADLTSFAGQEILLRFQYVTDAAVHEQGFAIDDIAIPELGYADGGESDTGWELAGFVHSGHILPQSFIVQAILVGDEAIKVERLTLNEQQQGQWLLPLSSDFDEVVVIVAGNTAVTRQPAGYGFVVREGEG